VISLNDPIEMGESSNVLINREDLWEALWAYRFDPELGHSCGEDPSFFHDLYRPVPASASARMHSGTNWCHHVLRI
jgi:hypothetical protein